MLLYRDALRQFRFSAILEAKSLFKSFSVSVLAILSLWLTISPAHSLPRKTYFKSSGKSIAVDWFYPEKLANLPRVDARQSTPIVIILHGAGGLGTDSRDGFFQQLAQELTRQGNSCAIVHYMDQTNMQAADAVALAKHFGTWLKTVRVATSYILELPLADKNNVSILGHSLGAQLALHTADGNPKLASVVDMAGSFVLPAGAIKAMPPILILHGTKDTTVPLSRERQLIDVLKRANSTYEEHILSGVDHSFSGVSFDTLTKTINKFLNKYRR